MSLLEPAWRGADYLAQLEGATLLGVYKISAIITIVTVALAALTMSGRAQGPSEGVSGRLSGNASADPGKAQTWNPFASDTTPRDCDADSGMADNRGAADVAE